MKIRIGSRQSRLAIIQAEMLIASIKENHPEIETELVTMTTTGDRILNKTLDQIGGKGLFVKELDAALLEGRVDVTVHSCKDLPMHENPLLPLVAFSQREDARDALVLPDGISSWNGEGVVGCSSLRRKLQLEVLYPGISVAPVRGNVQTRLQKLDNGEFSALVLASAGLKRLGLENCINRFFLPEEMMPAAGQGILAVQMRAGEDTSFLNSFSDASATICAKAERAFVRVLGGGCSSPVAAYATVSGDEITIHGMYVSECGGVFKGEVKGACAHGEMLAAELAQALKEGAK